MGCPAGTFSTAKAATFCLQCDVASFSSVPGQTACAACPPVCSRVLKRLLAECAIQGEYSSLRGSSNCSSCASGRFANVAGHSVCSSCGPGTFAQTGATACSPCAAGHVQNLNGQSSCSACSPGYTATLPQSTVGALEFIHGVHSRCLQQCTLCDKGTYAAVAGSPTCSPCPGGTFQGFTGQVCVVSMMLLFIRCACADVLSQLLARLLLKPRPKRVHILPFSLRRFFLWHRHLCALRHRSISKRRQNHVYLPRFILFG